MERLRRIIRRVVAGVCTGSGFWLLLGSLPQVGIVWDPLSALAVPPLPYGRVVYGILLLAAAMLGFVPDLAMLIAGFLGDCWATLFFPEARFNKPTLSYTLADFYFEQGRHAEALAEYQKIIRHYPDERLAYLGLISLCRLTGARRLAEKYERRFRKRFAAKITR